MGQSPFFRSATVALSVAEDARCIVLNEDARQQATGTRQETESA
jgi:hypothetical protein